MRNVSTVNRLIIKSVVCLMLPVFVAVAAFAQQKRVTGKVTSNAADSPPVVGANVTAKKSKLVTQTGPDGNFSFVIPSDETMLSISYVGFETQDVPIGEGNILVSLKSHGIDLNEVVVIGYGTQKKKLVMPAACMCLTSISLSLRFLICARMIS